MEDKTHAHARTHMKAHKHEYSKKPLSSKQTQWSVDESKVATTRDIKSRDFLG